MNKKVATGARILLGLIFFVFGLNGFLNFIPTPPDLPPAMMEFMGALMKTGYFLPVLKATETLCGLLLLSGFFVPLALVLLSPIVVQIFLFHLFMTPGAQNLVLPLVIGALMIVNAKAHWNVFRPLLKKK